MLRMHMHDPHMYVQVDEVGTTGNCLLEQPRFLVHWVLKIKAAQNNNKYIYIENR